MTTAETLSRRNDADIDRRYDFMMEAVNTLGREAWKRINDGLEMQLKPDGTKVTTADIALNDRFIELVEASHPNDLVWGEERSNSEKNDLTAADKQWMWLIDPIDGTSGFWRSYQQQKFDDCTANIMITGFAPGETRPTMSVISNPFNRDPIVLSAVRGLTLMKTKRLQSPQTIHLGSGSAAQAQRPQTVEEVGRYEENWWPDSTPDLRRINRLMPSARRINHPIFMGSVALGDVDLCAFPGPSHPHDVAPGALIAHNAGAEVRALDGSYYSEIDWRHDPINGVVATTNRALAQDFLEKLEG